MAGVHPIREAHDAARHRLADATQRYTRGRQAVVELLATADAPATINELLERDGTLSQSSVYRNLALLESVGVVHRIVTTDEHARFELAEDVTGQHHHHLVCTSCGIVLDVLLPVALEEQLHRALADAARAHRFRGDHHRVDLSGRCVGCS